MRSSHSYSYFKCRVVNVGMTYAAPATLDSSHQLATSVRQFDGISTP